jgi:hypothetical protein
MLPGSQAAVQEVFQDHDVAFLCGFGAQAQITVFKYSDGPLIPPHVFIRPNSAYPVLGTQAFGLSRCLANSRRYALNYAERHRAGLRVGTASTEVTANFPVNRRMNKSEQMRWSRGPAPIFFCGFAVPSTMVRAVPASDRNSSQPTIHTRQWRSPPDPQFCGSPPIACLTD